VASGTHGTHSPHERPTIGSLAPIAVVFGFATAIGMWLVWLVGHQPWIKLPGWVAGPTMVGVLALGCLAAGRAGGKTLGWAAGAGSGVLAALLNLLILGSLVSEHAGAASGVASPEPGAGGLTPSAGAAMAGFVALGLATGLLFGGVGGLSRPDPPHREAAWWASRFAVLGAISVVPLLLLGGLVTSTDSGLAVPDWPGTYGANMFLYPIALMADPRVFLEHTHRLFGSLVGLTTIAQAVFIWSVAPLRRPGGLAAPIGLAVVGSAPLLIGLSLHTGGSLGGMAFGGVAFGAALVSLGVFGWSLWRGMASLAAACLIVMVSAQGVLGGTRVTEASPLLGSIHGVLGQLFFASMALFAAWMTPWARARRTATQAPAAWTVKAAAVLLAALTLQLVLGALYRHGSAANPPSEVAGPALHGHMAFSILVVVAAIVVGFAMVGQGAGPSAASEDRAERLASRRCGLVGRLLVASVFVQFLLGWAAFALVTGAGPRAVPTADELATAQPVPVAEAVVTLAHQANGAGLLALAAAAIAWSGLALPMPRGRVAQPATT